MSYLSLWHRVRRIYADPTAPCPVSPDLPDDQRLMLSRLWSAAIATHDAALGSAAPAFARWWFRQRERIAFLPMAIDRADEFWRTSFALARALTTRLRRLRNDHAEPLRVVVEGDRIDVTGNASGRARWTVLRTELGVERGESIGQGGQPVPNTTVHDVEQVAAMWTDWTARSPHAMPTDTLGGQAMREGWAAAVARVRANALGRDPHALYPDNERFWLHDVKLLAEFIDRVGVDEERWWTSLGVPIHYAATGARSLATGSARVAKATASAAVDLAKGGPWGLGNPVLLGAAIVGAVLLAFVALKN